MMAQQGARGGGCGGALVRIDHVPFLLETEHGLSFYERRMFLARTGTHSSGTCASASLPTFVIHRSTLRTRTSKSKQALASLWSWSRAPPRAPAFRSGQHHL